MNENCHFKIIPCGSNGAGQLGVGHQTDLLGISREKAIEFKSKPVKITGGGNHTLVLCENGTVHAAGDISEKLINSIPESSKNVFKQITFNETSKVKNIASGWEFCTLITQDNKIYTSGIGLNGELGLGKSIQQTDCFTEVNVDFGDLDIVDIKSSIHSVIVQLSNGELWGWGNNKKGQLLPLNGNKSLKLLWEPTKLPFLPNEVLEFTMGREYTLLKTTLMVLMGADRFGLNEEILKRNINSKDITKLMSMWSSIHCELIDESNIISMGNNSHGQMFPGSQENLSLFAVGSEHGLCYDELTQTVYAWGWGEHGNCGLPYGKSTIENVTFDFLNPIYKASGNEEIISLFAGCATSWIVVSYTTGQY